MEYLCADEGISFETKNGVVDQVTVVVRDEARFSASSHALDLVEGIDLRQATGDGVIEALGSPDEQSKRSLTYAIEQGAITFSLLSGAVRAVTVSVD